MLSLNTTTIESLKIQSWLSTPIQIVSQFISVNSFSVGSTCTTSIFFLLQPRYSKRLFFIVRPTSSAKSFKSGRPSINNQDLSSILRTNNLRDDNNHH